MVEHRTLTNTNNIENNFRLASILDSYRVQMILCCCAAVFGMLWSKEVVISIPMIFLAVAAVFELRYPFSSDSPQLRLQIRPKLKERLSNKKAWLWIAVPFFLVLFSVPYSEDWSYLLERLRIKLPFLVLPFAFAVAPRLSTKDLYIIASFFVLTALVASIGVLWNYGQNYEQINTGISRGQPIPTPSNHIRFSLAVAMAILVSATLYLTRFRLKFRQAEKLFFGFATVFLFVFIHILSVRSGLAALYAAIGLMTVQWIFATKNWGKGLLLLGGLIALPFVAMQCIPSFQNKFYYAKYDFYQSMRGEQKNYSDGERLISLSAAVDIIKAHPVLGVGAGDLKKEMNAVYQKRGIDYVNKMPHSQFFSVTAGTGFVGLVLFLVGFCMPLFYQKSYKNYLFAALHLMFFLSFFTENTFENNFGLSLWLFALLIGMNYLQAYSITSKDLST